VGTTLAQNTEGAARMDALESQSILTEKVSEKVYSIKPSESNVVSDVKPIEKTSKIEVTNTPIASNKIIKAERIKKNLKPENSNKNNAIGTLTLIGIILSAIGLIFVATIILWLIGVIFLIIGLILLIVGLATNK
ncbi:MAG: hypothetical protein RMJ97_11820, partial [Raineya sp.]|nr:hypothetical protein [Raineya sp.]